jgi:hypothetical protein
MLVSCGYTYDRARDAYTNGGRALPVDTILAHTELWLAQWITETLAPSDAEMALRYEVTAPVLTPAASARRTT